VLGHLSNTITINPTAKLSNASFSGNGVLPTEFFTYEVLIEFNLLTL
jgi:hypothetical protein